jgi:hypothetical protein
VFLRVVAAVPAAAALPWGCGDNDVPHYLTDLERRVLEACADRIFPPDEHGPGAAALGAVDYIEQLLTAFEHDPPRLHAVGPFSDRNPFPAADGSLSGEHPADGFREFLPLSRVQERGWRLRLYGSAGVPGGGPNDAILGPIVGLRDLLRDSIAEAIAASGLSHDELHGAALMNLYDLLPDDTRDQVDLLVLQSVFGLPEYGGNRDRGGWRTIYFDGDSMPLGYTFIDPGSGQIADRPDHPVIGPAAAADPDPMDEEIVGLYSAAVTVLGGKQFY